MVDLLSGENHTTSGEVSFGPVNTRQTEGQRLTKHGDGRINEGRGGKRLALALGKSCPKGLALGKSSPKKTVQAHCCHQEISHREPGLS